MRPRTIFSLCIFFSFATCFSGGAENREERVRSDIREIGESGNWIYNDFAKGQTEARRNGKPMLVILRCIPCIECRAFDEQVAHLDPAVRALMDQFVCVRLISTNGLDLALFQFDYDLSFAGFLLNADGTVYGRFGTRSRAKDSHEDISMAGFAATLTGALELHKNYPTNRAALAGKRGLAARFPSPEKYPSLSGRYRDTLDYQGKVVASCIHCHQVGEAERRVLRDERQAMPEAVLFPYPMPDLLGLTLDTKERAKVARVAPDSSAAKDGFQQGDEIVSLEGQPLLSIADMQWVLQTAAVPAKLQAEVRRGDRVHPLELTLAADWRRKSNIGWRPTSWDLRRMVTGGLKLEDIPDTERRSAKLGADTLALRVEHVGEYGEHAIAKKAGVKKDDIVVNVNANGQRLTESELMAWLVQSTKPGDKLPVTVLRGERRVEVELTMQ